MKHKAYALSTLILALTCWVTIICISFQFSYPLDLIFFSVGALIVGALLRHCKIILINIEPIEKCKHPKDKIRQTSFSYRDASSYGFDAGMPVEKTTYKCECGAQVQPKEFEVVK